MFALNTSVRKSSISSMRHSQWNRRIYLREMGALRLIFLFLSSLSIINIAVRGAVHHKIDLRSVTKLTLSDKADTTGYHLTCHASKLVYDENFKWQHSTENCGLQKSFTNFDPLKEDKYNKIVNSETKDEFQSTLTLVGSNGKETGPKHCVCCVVKDNYSICSNLTMQHEHDVHHDHHQHHHQ